uniref:Ribosomal RNA-processing protein 42 n=1 Tax=Lygus hesperus TaxID=30085 RepID=A0A0A9X2M3_LYGHE
MGLLSPEEKIYIVHGLEHNVRTDGRSRFQYRPLELEVDLLPSAMGSARVRVGNTDVIACVKANTFTPPPDKPAEGKLEFLVHFSGVADPENEGRASETLRDQYTHVFNKLYSSVPLNDWCIKKKFKCWKFNVDICVVSLDGNLYDAVGFAVKSALATAVVPIVKVSNKDKGEYEFSISDDPSDTWSPNVEGIPIFVTASKIGEAVMIDPTSQEEKCSSFSCIVACTEAGKILFTMKTGAGSLHPTTLTHLISKASKIGVDMNKKLRESLSSAKSGYREILGYL